MPSRPSRSDPAPTDREKLARPDGFEPPTLGFEDRYSIQLSYGRFVRDIRDLVACDRGTNQGFCHPIATQTILAVYHTDRSAATASLIAWALLSSRLAN